MHPGLLDQIDGAAVDAAAPEVVLDGVELPLHHHLAHARALGDVVHPHPVWRREARGAPVGVFGRALHPPLHVAGADAVFVLEEAPRPQRRSLLVLVDAYALALHVLGPIDARAVPRDGHRPEELASREDRETDPVRVPLRGDNEQCRDRHLRHVELLVRQLSVEQLAGGDAAAGELDALGLHGAVEDGLTPGVRAEREAELKRRRHVSFSLRASCSAWRRRSESYPISRTRRPPAAVTARSAPPSRRRTGAPGRRGQPARMHPPPRPSALGGCPRRRATLPA